MQLHELRGPRGARKRRKIVGRGKGSGHGKTSCRGHGRHQRARSGRGILRQLEGGQMPLIRRLPKVGFRSKRPVLYKLVKLESLAVFKSGTVVNAKILKERGLIRSIYKPFKVLGDGALNNAITVEAYSFSQSATDKIVKAGGKAVVINHEVLKKTETAPADKGK